jgi:hypothetical protein
MVDHYPLQSNNWRQPEPTPEPEDEQEAQHPEVEVVWNHYEKGGEKTIAVKVSVRLPRMDNF